MASTHHHMRRTIDTQLRVDRLVRATMRRFYTIVVSAAGLGFILCCLGAIR